MPDRRDRDPAAVSRPSPPRRLLVFPDPVLAARDITLRGLAPADVTWITAACSDRELSRHLPAMPYPYSQADARAFIEQAARRWAEGTSAAFVIAQATSGEASG